MPEDAPKAAPFRETMITGGKEVAGILLNVLTTVDIHLSCSEGISLT